MTGKEILVEIRQLTQLGVNAIPVYVGEDVNGNRIVKLLPWERYKDTMITMDEVNRLIQVTPHGFNKVPNGIAVITGKVSGHLRMVDVDLKNRDSEHITIEYILQAAEAMLEAIFDKLIIEKSKNGGLHFFYRSKDIAGQTNIMLARSKAGKELINEFTGPHLGFTSPTEGYELIQGSWEDLEVLTDEEIAEVHIFARSFNNYTDKKEEVQSNEKKSNSNATWEELPGDHFSRDNSPLDYLLANGWSHYRDLRNGDVVLTKPGDNHTSRRSAVYETSKDKVWILTTSVPELEQFRVYDTFQLFTFMEHGGDFRKAAAALVKDGFGTRKEKAEKREENDAFDVFHNVLVSDAGLVKNEITKEIERDGEVLTENQLNNYLVEIMRSDRKVKRLSQANYWLYINSEQIPTINPLKEFFESNKSTTQGAELKKLLQCFKPYDEFKIGVCLRKWLIGMVAQVYQNEFPNILCPVFYGEINTGKTSFFKQLLPDLFSNYFSESDGSDLKSKDEKAKMCYNLMVIFDDMGFSHKSEAKDFRSFISSSFYDFRAPYAKKSEKQRRLASVCATSNHDDFITESEHNRRMIPIMIEEIDFELFNTIDKRELLLELYEIYNNSRDFNETWTLTKDEARMLSDMSRENEAITVEHEMIMKHFEPIYNESDPYGVKMTASDVMKEIEARIPRTYLDVRKVGKSLKSLGFSCKRERHNGNVRTVYLLKIVDDIDAGNYKQDEVSAKGDIGDVPF